MCYVLLLSTSSEENLAQYNNEFIRFSRDLPAIADTGKLKYRNKWYIGSKAGCSCTFRHLYSVELGFGEPVDWYEEDPEDIAATLQLIQIIRDLASRGEDVDCIDAWGHESIYEVAEAELEVDLSQVSNAAFRFFENHHFIFRNAS